MNSVMDRFKQRGIVAGGELYLAVADGYEFVEAVRSAHGCIFGVEAVRVEGGWIRPLPDQVADFSALFSDGQSCKQSGRAEASCDAAIAFLRQLPSEEQLRVVFTLEAGG